MSEEYTCKHCRECHEIDIACPSCEKSMKRSLNPTHLIILVLVVLFSLTLGMKVNVDFAVKGIEKQCNDFLLESHGLVKNFSDFDLGDNELLINFTVDENGSNVSRYKKCSSSIGCEIN